MYSNRYFPRSLPEPLSGLATLAVDMRWSWNHASDALWRKIDPELWESTGNPWFILESVSQTHLESLAVDEEFLSELHHQLAQRHLALSQSTWFAEHIGRDDLTAVAYFSLEFGLNEALPLYSGGLGILAGDFLKTASDLGVPVYGIGLLYQQGYFRQGLDQDGSQLEFYPYNDPAILPITPLRDADGNWIRITVELPGRELNLRAWEARVGRVFLYLLDSNDPLNLPQDRGITEKLYGGGLEVRLQQEIALGIGGWRLLAAKGIDCDICHLNEGHAAFAVLERARSFMEKAGVDFDVALRCTRMGNVFTTHTPVEAAFDRYPIKMIQQYTHDYVKSLGVSLEYLFDLGRSRPGDGNESFNMACLALHGSGAANGVSRLHGEVSREIFQPLFPRWPQGEVPVTHVTNGVHMPSWDSSFSDVLWTESCGKKRWLGSQESIEEEINAIDDQTLWTCRSANRLKLIENVRKRLAQQQAIRGVREKQRRDSTVLLDPNALTIGFARRFTAYKRPNLLLHDPERLTRLFADPERPIQLVIAGKAHPDDREGKRLVREWVKYAERGEVKKFVVFIQDYDMDIAARLVQGVDLWINTPRRPWEASGTSGMKVLINGGLNLSELDGWWAEAYSSEVGWALGDRQEHGLDPAWDAAEAGELYRLLEEEVIPAFYDRDENGIPTSWVARMRASMAQLTPRFSSNRMLRQYTREIYLPSARALKRRIRDNGRLGDELERWMREIAHHWQYLHFGRKTVAAAGAQEYVFQVPVYLDDLSPEAVRVELYAEPLDAGTEPERIVMSREKPLPGTVNGYLYTAAVSTSRSADDYTPRIIPYHQDAMVPLENNHILWYR
jgi:starch phosphorylase